MKKINLDSLETVASYAEKHGYSTGHVYTLINTGKLDTHTIGKTRLIIVNDK